MDLNWISITVATVFGMMLGAFWYSPLAFGQAWLKCIGKTEDQLGSPVLPLAGSVLACFLSALSLALIISQTGSSGLLEGFYLGAVIGVGLIFPAFLSDSLFCGWGSKLLFIQAGYRVTYIIVMCMIIAGWPV